ncbi:hypothetical protein [Kribbella deserti]|uniref:Uncharacterized protein n=1 Tax=Kribbella deserti TaxID=1926257 RepID=A0ABV6QDW9_9ACTN
MSNTRMTEFADHFARLAGLGDALDEFRDIWGTTLLVDELATRMTCDEANSLANLLGALGDGDVAGHILTAHTGEDAEAPERLASHVDDDRIDWDEIGAILQETYGPENRLAEAATSDQQHCEESLRLRARRHP